MLFKHPPTRRIYPLSLHDALPISAPSPGPESRRLARRFAMRLLPSLEKAASFSALIVAADSDRRNPKMHCKARSEEHTSELQSHSDLVCRLLLEKRNLVEAAHCCN